ncbi:E3 ubiquitin-protein ligase TRIM56-like [Gigantopelta aegis]|uniref:E3 ubiquitin-protein ligase TRIM56-like n=1 Tax=Gigantopelta aegis TaxID=1735272 RepID=UPI001B88BC53|nr:E3 ubiquitin-protein ligase TRIM56-like [Gigantopelta aegis]
MATSADHIATAVNESADVCSICIEQFKDPRRLTCFHTFCFGCLKTFVSRSSEAGKFSCPLCRYDVTIPEEGVSGFPENIYADARAKRQAHREEESCGVCEQRAANMCRECDVLLCELCTKLHRALPICRSHLLINLDDSAEGKRLLSRERFCEKHKDEKLIFFCKHCSMVICRNCKLTRHDGHKTVDVSDVVEDARVHLAERKGELEKYVKQMKSSYDTMQFQYVALNVVLHKAKIKIDTSADRLIDMISEIRNKATDKVNVIEKNNESRFEDANCAYTQKQLFLKSQMDHIDDVLKDGLGCDVMTADGEVSERMSVIENEISLATDDFIQNIGNLSIHATSSVQLQYVHCVVSDVIGHVLQGLPKQPVAMLINNVNLGRGKITSITLTQSSNAWVGKIVSPWYSSKYNKICLCNLNQISLKLNYKFGFEVDPVKLKTDGVNQLLRIYNSKNTDTKIRSGECKNLKKEYPQKDENSNGDRCWVDDQDGLVNIKLSSGILTNLTFNPFSNGHPFKPCDVCWGKKDEVYIVDSGSKTIVVYSLSEGFVKALFIPGEREFDPSAVAMDTEGNLWIGEDDGILSVCKVE